MAVRRKAGAGARKTDAGPVSDKAPAGVGAVKKVPDEFDIAAAEDSPEYVAKLEPSGNVRQIFVVACLGGTRACVSMHQKDDKGVWKEIFMTTGCIGQNSLGKEREGDARTPAGIFHFNGAFGINPDPGCKAFQYRQVTDDNYWSCDCRDGYGYNKMVSIRDYPDLDKEASEHLIDYRIHYRYCMNISWNEECKKGKGSAIFLHCLHPEQSYTQGCVAIPEDKVIAALKYVRKNCVVVIDEMKKLNPDFSSL